MRKVTLVMLFISLACLALVALVDGDETISEKDIFPHRSEKDCACKATLKDQLRLFYKYRGLYDFRRYHYSDAKDFELRSGTVIFLNSQDQVMRLKCPCKDVSHWFQFGEGFEAETFNQTWGKEDKRGEELNVKSPESRNYYRTIGCFSKHGKYHYFNIFTRPAPKTDFPVSFREGEEPDKNKNFWRCYTRTNSKTNCLQGPYNYTWLFPNDYSRPKNVGPDRLDKESGIRIGEKMMPNDTKGEIDCYKKRSWDPCTKPAVLSYVNLSLMEKPQQKHAGVYECVVTDRNGLTSSFRFDNLNGKFDANVKRIAEMKFGGFVLVHIRGFIYVFLPIILIVVIFLVTILFVWGCPDNTEEYEEQLRELAQQRKKDKLNASATEAETSAATEPVKESPEIDGVNPEESQDIQNPSNSP